jgi:hypothetical protein
MALVSVGMALKLRSQRAVMSASRKISSLSLWEGRRERDGSALRFEPCLAGKAVNKKKHTHHRAAPSPSRHEKENREINRGAGPRVFECFNRVADAVFFVFFDPDRLQRACV